MVSDMRGKLATVAVLTVAVAACMGEGTPATTPASIPTTTTTTTTTVPPASTTTTVATTTTLDRLAQIEAIFQDLEERRLQALYDGDRESFRALFANDEYMERSMVLFDLVEFQGEWRNPAVSVSGVLADRPECIAAVVESDHSGTLVGGGVGSGVEVLESRDGVWGISFAGEGWECDGPHPFSP